jgi:hypothetical protein
LVPARLQEDGQEALIAVTRSVQTGEPLLRGKLLASIFYEELRRELRRHPETDTPERAILAAATALCGRAAIHSSTPAELLAELRGAVAMLTREPPVEAPRARPVLRVIEGGLSEP